jgi:hypothetical protein
MATPETVALCTCQGCKRDVDVKINAGGFAYYHCGCGHSERTHNASSSQRFMSTRTKPVNFDGPDTHVSGPKGEAGNPAPAGQTTPPAESKTEDKPAAKRGFSFY